MKTCNISLQFEEILQRVFFMKIKIAFPSAFVTKICFVQWKILA